jgi:hypothetical protein
MWQIIKLLWPGNSPNLNAIKPTWFWIKKETTKQGLITSEAKLREAWIKYWNKML